MGRLLPLQQEIEEAPKQEEDFCAEKPTPRPRIKVPKLKDLPESIDNVHPPQLPVLMGHPHHQFNNSSGMITRGAKQPYRIPVAKAQSLKIADETTRPKQMAKTPPPSPSFKQTLDHCRLLRASSPRTDFLELSWSLYGLGLQLLGIGS